jgi:membrane-bound serine protease (ClpP class)
MRLLTTLFGLLLAEVCLAAPKVIAVDIDGVVHPITAEIVGRAIEQAKLEGAQILLIRLNTPGGLADATRQIIEKMVASPVPVVTFVTPSGGRAASAGFFILEAGDVAAMAAGTNTGAATPVLLGQEMDPVMRQKVQNDAAASVRSMATKRGRNSALAEKAVLESKSFTDKEALDNKLIDLIATDEADLYRKLDGREAVRFDGRKQVLRLEIYVEFSSPGLIVPGVAGAILVLLGLSALSVLPINWVGAALLLLAIALFVLEAKFASHGILAVGGTAAMILGALLLVSSPLPEMRIHLSTAVGLALPFAIITTILVSLVIRARANKVVTGAVGMLDEIGVARTALAPAGKVFVHGEYWDAVSSAPVEAGAHVRVIEVRGLTLKVEPVSKNSGG